jgi:hypothetical protein
LRQVLDRCHDALFTGILRVHTRQAEGELWFLSGMLERVRFGVSLGDEAMRRLLGADAPKVDIVPCLPNPAGGFDKVYPIEGDLATTKPVDLLRFCETHALTCTVDLRSGASSGEATYRLGELISIRCDAGSDRGVVAMLEWTAGQFRFILPSIELPASTTGAVTQIPPAGAVEETVNLEGSAWRTAANEALKRKAVEVEAKHKAEAKRIAEEAESRRFAEEAEATRLAAEAEFERQAREAETRRLAEEAESRRRAEEDNARRLAEEAAAHRLAGEAEARRLAGAAEAKRLAEEADARRRAEEDHARRLAEEAAAAERSREEDARRPSVEAPALSIVVCLQRVTTEYVHIAVPVTRAMMSDAPDGDGSRRVDSAALFVEAQRLAREGNVAWQTDGEPRVRLHPRPT